MQTFRESGLHVDLHPTFLSHEEAERLFQHLNEHAAWGGKRGVFPSYKRVNCTYGDPGLHYVVKFREKEVHRSTIAWDPALVPVRDRLHELTHQAYNVCVVQRYPHGGVGINPHRDKEMTPGSTICGVSLGETRTLVLQNKNRRLELNLPPGSLYVLHPPTNDFFAHSIEKDDSVNPRISLTFRNYKV